MLSILEIIESKKISMTAKIVRGIFLIQLFPN